MNIHIKRVLCLTLLLLTSVGCTGKTVEPDSSENTAHLMKLAIEDGDYNRFNSLFSEGRKGSISEREFKDLKEITTSGSGYISYELLTFENGEMLLVRLTSDDGKTGYRIEDVRKVPEGMKELFQQ